MGGVPPPEIRAEVNVEGYVQGVGFRYFARREALRLGVVGEVRNPEDGTVSIICESTKERIERLLEKIRQAPPPMHVQSIKVEYRPATGTFKTFRIVTGDLVDEIVEGFATGASYFEVMFARQDETLRKQDLMLEKQDHMLEKQDLMLDKQDALIREVAGLRTDMRILLEDRIARIEKDIAEIKARLGLLV